MTTISPSFVLDPHLKEQLKARSNLRGALSVAKDYGLLLAAFALCIALPHPVTYLAAVLLLAGVHAGFAILTHEAAHRSLFATARLNDWVGQYLCALPNFNNMPMYRAYHMAHHRLAGTAQDPDLVMVERYPISRANLRRKLLRDLSGLNGLRFFIGMIGMAAGYWKFQQNGVVERIAYDRPMGFGDYLRQFLANGGGYSLLWQLALMGVLAAFGHGWLYLLWVAAFVFVFPLCMRLRQLADHAVVHNALSSNPLDHARSSRASWWEKLLLSPHHEHYHLEHHLMPSAPHWNLPKLHAHLVERGLIPAANQANGLADVLRRVTR